MHFFTSHIYIFGYSDARVLSFKELGNILIYVIIVCIILYKVMFSLRPKMTSLQFVASKIFTMSICMLLADFFTCVWVNGLIPSN
jgi:hypothetical protein